MHIVCNCVDCLPIIIIIIEAVQSLFAAIVCKLLYMAGAMIFVPIVVIFKNSCYFVPGKCRGVGLQA